jgi:hypothetical protein
MSVAYPPPPVGYPAPRLRPASGSSAETLVFAALILQVIGGVILFGAILYLFGYAAYHPFPFAWVALIAAAIVGGVAVLFLYLAYEYSYLRIQRGEYQQAQAPTLVLGILSLFLGLIPGILYLIGYVKLGDAVREQQTPPGFFAPGPGFAAPTSPSLPQIACRGCGRISFVGQFPYCPFCGQKLGN